jgi:protein gp37
MGDRSAIEWTDATWNPIRARNLATGKIGWHCEHDSEGCRNCYAEDFNRRLGTGLSFKPGLLGPGGTEVFLDDAMLALPLRWWRPRMIFVNSMTDSFADFVTDEMIDKMFAVMALAHWHRFQVLTKRAKRMRNYFGGYETFRGRVWYQAMQLAPPNATTQMRSDISNRLAAWPLRNVWLGVSAEDQSNWDERKQYLRNVPAAVRFASFEPLLGPIVDEDFSATIQWAIVGGESGLHARPMHPDWERSIRRQCEATGVAYFGKQWGAWAPTEDGRMVRVGKKAAGRLFDGEEHNGMPQ